MSPARRASPVLVATLALACAPHPLPAPPPPPVTLPLPPAPPPIVRAADAEVTPLLAGANLGYDVRDHRRRTARDRSWVATCDDLFVFGAPAWIAARLAPAQRVPWRAYCDPPVTLPLPPPVAPKSWIQPEVAHREEAAEKRRSALRRAAIRGLERRVARADASAIDVLALGYLLAEKGFEDARESAWSCELCELGPPNRFSHEDFARTASSSAELVRARALFDRASGSPDDAGWLAAFCAVRIRWDLGGTDEAKVDALVARRSPEGVDGALAELAGASLRSGRVDRARGLLGVLVARAEGVPPAARAWFEALSGRPREALRAVVTAVAPFDAEPATDLLALGVTAAELAGMDGAPPGPRDGEARVAWAAALDALEALDAARARRWVTWIAEQAPESADAPAALEVSALLSEAEGDPRAASIARAVLASKIAPASAWAAALSKRAPYRADGLIRWPLSRLWASHRERAVAAVAAAANAEERAPHAAQALGRRCLWDEANPVRVGVTITRPHIALDGPVRAEVRACLEKLGPGTFSGIEGEVHAGIRSLGVRR